MTSVTRSRIISHIEPVMDWMEARRCPIFGNKEIVVIIHLLSVSLSYISQVIIFIYYQYHYPIFHKSHFQFNIVVEYILYML